MKYPKLVRNATTPVRVVIFSEESDEFGERPVILNKEFYCNYQDSSSVKHTAEKQHPEATGRLFFDGDILAHLIVAPPDFSISEEGILSFTGSVLNNGVLDFEDGKAGSDDIISGYVVLFGRQRKITNAFKARNFDGTVNYTRLDVI
jgi:hypothetical protein